MKHNKMTRAINSLSTAAVAIFFSQVLHESIHMFTAFFVGAKVRGFNLFGVDTVLFGDKVHWWQDIAIESSASLVNVLIGLITVFIFAFYDKMSAMTNQFLLQLGGFNLFMGFGYFMFDGMFYCADAAGDWKTIIRMYDGSIVLRVLLVIIGTGGLIFSYFWLARNIMVFVEQKTSEDNRAEAALPILMLPYIFYGILYLVLSIWHPLKFPVGTIIIFFQFIFGFSGFFWAYFLSVYWLTPKKYDSRYSYLKDKISFGWATVAVILLTFQIVVLLPTIKF